MKTTIRRGRRPRGFTLIEALYATMIVGLGVTALMMVFGAGTRINDYGNNLSTAVFLAEELRGMTDNLAFDALAGMDGNTYHGVDANGQALAGLDRYQQVLDVQPVDPVALTPLGASLTLRLTAIVTNPNGAETRFSWLRVKS
jgi:type II secretory pathway pseudopilin PulG